ncbi:MAG: hypothetical protein AAF495_16970 [Pseudomonadota bacterium]
MLNLTRDRLGDYGIGDVLVFTGYISPGGQAPVFTPGQHIKVAEISALDDALICFPADSEDDEFGDVVFLDEISGKATET